MNKFLIIKYLTLLLKSVKFGLEFDGAFCL